MINTSIWFQVGRQTQEAMKNMSSNPEVYMIDMSRNRDLKLF